MSVGVSRSEVAGLVAFVTASLAVLLLLLGRLGAVPLPGTRVHSVRALLTDAGGLPDGADVLVHGVKVGVVSALAAGRDGTLVTLALGPSAPALRGDASVRIGLKTPLGEPFVDLDPGRAQGRPGRLLAVRPTVAIDDALSFLDRGGRADARAVLLQLGRGAAPQDTSAEVGDALARLEIATGEASRLAAELRRQRTDLRTTISDGRTALDVLASPGAALRGLVAGARRTLSAVASQRSALGDVLERLPALERVAAGTLRRAEPLILRATPMVATVASAAPALTAALRRLPGAMSDLATVLSEAGAIRIVVLPALRAIRALGPSVARALGLLGPALADLVPVARYLGPRGNTIAAWFANTADLGSHGDAKGDWARFLVMFDPATASGDRAGAPAANSYTAPGDAAHNEPYAPGGYPRLMPYAPALRR